MSLSPSIQEQKANSVICQAAVFGFGSQAATSGDALIHCRSAPQHLVFGRMMSDIASKLDASGYDTKVELGLRSCRLFCLTGTIKLM